jgi:hypothetical protein
MWTGGVNNTGQPPADTYWAVYNPNITSNVVPVDVYSVVGGDKNGGATQLTPRGGYDSGTPGTGLGALLARKGPTTTRSATRVVSTSSPTGTSSSNASGSSHGLSKGAIAGTVIGALVGSALVAFGWFIISKRVHRRRQQRRESQTMQQQMGGYGVAPGYVVAPIPIASPANSAMAWVPPPAELSSGNPKAYAEARVSPLSSDKTGSQIYYPPPGEAPIMALVAAPVEMAHSRSPPPVTTRSATDSPSLVATGTSPNFSNLEDHHWQSYEAPPAA